MIHSRNYLRYILCAITIAAISFFPSSPILAKGQVTAPSVSAASAAPASAAALKSDVVNVGWGPVLGLVDTNSAAIRWSTTRPTACSIILNGKPAGNVISDGPWHQVSLENLEPDTKYTYQIEFSNGQNRTRSIYYEFTTAPKDLTNWSFIVFGDTRTNHDQHRSVINALGRINPRPWLAVHTGDMGENGSQTECWNNFFSIEKSLLAGIPFIGCMGNHEKGSPIFYRMFQNPLSVKNQPLGYYSFQFANAVFVVLNSESDPKPQTEFLEKTLERAVERKIPWKFVIWHQTPFSSGNHGGNVNLANLWVPIMEKYGATCGFYGHDHLYEHSIRKGFHHVTSGGGGAPLYAPSRKPNPFSKTAISKLHFLVLNVSAESVIVTAYGVDGKELDSFTISQ